MRVSQALELAAASSGEQAKPTVKKPASRAARRKAISAPTPNPADSSSARKNPSTNPKVGKLAMPSKPAAFQAAKAGPRNRKGSDPQAPMATGQGAQSAGRPARWAAASSLAFPRGASAASIPASPPAREAKAGW